MTNALGCACILTGPHSLLAPSRLICDWSPLQLLNNPSKFSPYPAHPPAVHNNLPPSSLGPVKIWSDGSAFNNGLDCCLAGAAWVSLHGATGSTRLADAPASNNIAEMTAVVMALLSWRHSDLLIHTDSRYVLNMVAGQLLANERDGWPDEILSIRPARLDHAFDDEGMPDVVSSVNLQRLLLYLLHSHDGYIQFKWVKAHNSDRYNSLTDKLAKEAAISGIHTFSLARLPVPPGWVDSGPVLNHQPLSSLTSYIIADTIVRPSQDLKSLDFRSCWTDWASGFSASWLDISHHIPNIWKINVPPQLRELLWKCIHNSLPLGRSWASKFRPGQHCPCNNSVISYAHIWHRPHCEETSGLRAVCCCCSDYLSIAHIWIGCSEYNMDPFRTLLHKKICSLVYLTWR